MTIRQNILAVKRRMLNELVDGGDFTDDVQRLSLAAVHGGQGSDAWGAYMSLFVDAGNAQQLARLMGTDNTGNNPDMNDARAYLASDGSCASTTVTNFGNGASVLLDEGLD